MPESKSGALPLGDIPILEVLPLAGHTEYYSTEFPIWQSLFYIFTHFSEKTPAENKSAGVFLFLAFLSGEQCTTQDHRYSGKDRVGIAKFRKNRGADE